MVIKNQQYLLFAGIVLFIMISLYKSNSTIEKLENQCNNQSSAADQTAVMGKSARDACSKVSTKAEEIAAYYGGIANIAQNIPIYSLLNPNNYRAGDSDTGDIMRNIINTNMSECDIKKIESDCVNSSAAVQINEIDNTKCEYCKTHLCEISNVTQDNIAKINQTCMLQSTIESLSKKTNSIDAQALAQVLQNTQGILSGDNKIRKENCNVIAPDLSTASYLEEKKKCANNLEINQENSLKFCGNATDIVQKNQFEAYQSCLQETSTYDVISLETKANVSTNIDIEQTSEGVSSAALIVGSILSIIVSSIVAFIIYKINKPPM